VDEWVACVVGWMNGQIDGKRLDSDNLRGASAWDVDESVEEEENVKRV
jgi:hypothetical protein